MKAVAMALFSALLGPALAAGETASKPVNTAAPKLTGTPVVGQSLACLQGSWANNPTGYAYAWLHDGSPIAGQTASTYTVQSADQGHSISCQVTASNVGGQYTISGLSGGSYKVSFSGFACEENECTPLNYLTQFFNGKSSSKAADSVSVTAGSTTSSINAEMHPGGQISGRVTDASTHAALANIQVCANGGGEFVGNCAATNGGGEYTIPDLATGSYKVEFSPGFEGGGNYAPQFYNGKSSSSEAESVSVTAGSTTSSINAGMHPGGQITGRVTDASSHAAIANIRVCAQLAGSGGFEFGQCATTSAGGEYTISSLATGSYKIEFVSGYGTNLNYLTQFYNGKSSFAEAEAVSVMAGSVTPAVNAAMQAGGQVTGTVTDASTHAALAHILVCALGASTTRVCTSTNAGGEYTISGLATGPYRVQFCLGVGCTGQNYLTQFYNGKSSPSEAESVSVAAGSTTSGINAAMRPGGQITGKVTDASTKALANISVCASVVSGGGFGGFGSCASTNASGEYTISGLATGSYKIEFRPGATCGEGLEAECTLQNYSIQFFNGKSSSSEAESVSVTAGNTTSSINAEMHPGGQISGRVTDVSTHAALANIQVCATSASGGAFGFGSCATTNSAGGSASATSNALAVPASSAPNSRFSLAKAPVFDAKTGDLDFFFRVTNPGTFSWQLFFKNADVGFADSLGLGLGEGEVAVGDGLVRVDLAAETAKKKGKRCKTGFTKQKGKCVRVLVSFASGSQGVTAGMVELKVHAGARAIKALNAGHALHVSGPFTFRSALGGAAVTNTESVVVHGHKKHGNKRGKHKGH